MKTRVIRKGNVWQFQYRKWWMPFWLPSAPAFMGWGMVKNPLMRNTILNGLRIKWREWIER